MRYGRDDEFEEWQENPSAQERVRSPSINRQGRPRAPMMPGEVAIRVGKFRKVPGSNQGLEGASEDFSYKRKPQEVSDLMRNFYQTGGACLGRCGSEGVS